LAVIEKIPWYTKTSAVALTDLTSDGQLGLSATEARLRIQQYGPNQLSREEHEGFGKELLEELTEPMVLLLLGTGVLYAIWGEARDAITIFAVILTLAGVELANEMRSKKALSLLRKLAEPTCLVRRAGQPIEVPIDAVVPGDVILLQAGRRVSADARLIEGYGLAADESMLTGESVPVDKDPMRALPSETVLAERTNMVYSGTLITRGRGLAVVTATGPATEMGQIDSLSRSTKEPPTPLQHAMSELSRSLVWLALGFALLVPVLGVIVAHQPLKLMLLTGLTLAFATIPEEMPIIITMVLALGSYRLSKHKVIVKKLRAVETLGAVTVIATDKTGTLTENRMQVAQLVPDSLRRRLLEIGVLCNTAAAGQAVYTGDPMEVALLRAAAAQAVDVAALRQSVTIRDELSFDTDRKRMSVLYEQGDAQWLATKGAPEVILALSSQRETSQGVVELPESDRQAILAEANSLAQAGMRVLALAQRQVPWRPVERSTLETQLTFIGLVALADPLRPEAAQAVAQCHQAGIRTVMITGDHPLTASAIAKAVGIADNSQVLTGTELDKLDADELAQAVERVSIYARTTPEQKLRLVRALQANGARVAVTGDGINDAPALVAADIGMAMGETGSDVAREASDIVLADDNFATIMHAVREGRLLFENLRKGVRYYLACKVALILSTLLPVLLGVPAPFAPVQIILMELFMDLAASATFVAEPAEDDLLARPPRDTKERFMSRAMVSSIILSGLGLFAAVATCYLLTWFTTHNLVTSQTVAFFTWLAGHVLLALNLRSERQPLVRLGLLSNKLMLIWGTVTLLFIIVVELIPGVQQAFKTTTLSGAQLLLITAAVLFGTFGLEVEKIIRYKSSITGGKTRHDQNHGDQIDPHAR
jgi:Ca2+-transporting ATPase